MSVPMPAKTAHPSRRFRWSVLVMYALLILISVVVLFPIYWMVLNSVQPIQYQTFYPPPLFFKGFDASSFTNLWTNYDIGPWLWNSTQLALMVTGICLVLSLLGAYVLSPLKWKGKPLFGFFILLTQMMPGAIIIVPVFKLYRDLNLLNSLPPLAFVQAAFALPICIWILKNVFDSVPTEVIEAALSEGCGTFGVLFRIMLPLSLPGLVAVAVVAFFFSWNEFLFAQTMINDTASLPASVGISTLQSQLDTPIQLVLAGGIIFSALPVIFYIVVQRYIISGLTAGAVKG